VRTALRALEQEGLVMRLGARGYAARSISPGQIRDAIEVRGVLEGFAARRAAERGVDGSTRRRFEALLDEGDRLFATGELREADLERYTAYNIAFHDLLVAAAGNDAIAQSLARNGFQPFAGAGAFALDYGDLETEYAHLLAAHRQHRSAFQAMEEGDGELAEQIMRDHALAAIRNGRVFEQAMPPVGPLAAAAARAD
jgi:GntR family transcriptional regulator of vanillate catabolism